MSNLPFWIEAMKPWHFIDNLPPPQPPITMSDIKKTKTHTKNPKQSWFIPHNFKYMIYYLIKKLTVLLFKFFFFWLNYLEQDWQNTASRENPGHQLLFLQLMS